MSRIKFLDILEETKMKPLYQNVSTPEYTQESPTRFQEHHRVTEHEHKEPAKDFTPRKRERAEFTEDKLTALREKSLLRDSGVSFDSVESSREPRITQKSQISQTPQVNINRDDSKVLLTGALFVLFGGMLFLSGFWVGKTITTNVKSDREVMMAQSFNDFKKTEQPSDMAMTSMPMATTVETMAPPKPETPMRVIEPAMPLETDPVKPTPVKAPTPVAKPSQEYIIQISAHSTMDAARLIEDQLRTAGFSAYTSESVIGDSVFFRVRLRGFNTKKGAEDILAQIKAKNIGQDGFVLTLE